MERMLPETSVSIKLRPEAKALVASLGSSFSEFSVEGDSQGKGLKGPPFTWSNNRSNDSLVMEKLDRAVANSKWRVIFEDSIARNLIIRASDHSLIVLDTFPPKFRICRKLRVVQHNLKSWNTSEFGYVEDYIRKLKSELELLQSNPHDPPTFEKGHPLLSELDLNLKREEIKWNQRAKVD
ncbi:uncharacterized protein LOC122662855 [Telopea speciosissima]|uniref:uncharacterized protein LOC122662855 n=1 Tax=Telopea speciosissima TaxID=54955 RepID=UPI001CC79A17|nr:uncharacterized protein LOC122662855 [Telopea speciosissima]